MQQKQKGCNSQLKRKIQLLSSQLQEIKDMLKSNIEQFKTIKNNNKKNKSRLETENQTLFYELSIYSKVFNKLLLDKQKCQIVYQQAQQRVRVQFIEQNYKQIQKSNKSLLAKHKQENDRIQQLLKQNQMLNQNLKISKKKNQQFDKLGGVQKYNSLKGEIVSLKMRNTEINQELKTWKQKTNAMDSKFKIMNQLNKQTQEKLASFMVNSNRQNKQNQIRHVNSKKEDIQILSYKEQIRELKGRVKKLQQQKNAIKQKYKQNFDMYSKVIARPK